MKFLIGSLIVPIILGIVAYLLQNRSWWRQNKENTINRTVDAAVSVNVDLSRLIDQRLFFQRRLVWALIDKANNRCDKERMENSHKNYDQSVVDWNKEFTKCKTMIDVYFGDRYMLRFEEEIHGEFVRVGQRIEHYMNSSKNLSILTDCNDRLNRHGRTCFIFSKALTGMIKDRDVGSLPIEDKMYLSKPENMSYFYLIKRLCGIVD